MKDNLFDEANAVKSNWIKWGKPGDWIRGTLLDVRIQDNKMSNKPGAKQRVFEFKAIEGSFHLLKEDKTPFEMPNALVKGEIWVVSGNTTFENQMRNIKVGQIFGAKFLRTEPSKQKGYAPAKIVKVYADDMDPEYMGEKGTDIDVDPSIG